MFDKTSSASELIFDKLSVEGDSSFDVMYRFAMVDGR